MSILERIKNSDWVRQSFLLTEDQMSAQILRLQSFTSASFSFTDTTLGGNFTINNPPQFTRHADIKMGGNTGLVYQNANQRIIDRRRSLTKNYGNTFSQGMAGANGASESHGMGRAYFEVLDQNAQIVTFRFGVPEYNSMTRFLGNFYSAGASSIARTGRSGSLFFSAGNLIGAALVLPFFPMIVGGRILRFMMDKPASKFCYLKPTMPLYWQAVDIIANGIAVNMGLTPRYLTGEQSKIIESRDKFGPSNYKAYHELLPDIISPEGRINTYAVATRAQRLNSRTHQTLMERWEGVWSNDGSAEGLRKSLELEQEYLLTEVNGQIPAPDKTFNQYLEAYNSLVRNQPASEGVDSMEDAAVLKPDENGNDPRVDMSDGGDFWDFFNAERRDGSNFVSFRVSNIGTVSESFNSSTGPTELAQSFNQTSSAARTKLVNFANGNLGEGMLASALEATTGAIKDLAMGVLEKLKLSGLAALGGSGLIDIPDTWQESSAQMPSTTYTIELRTPYGNAFSRFINLMFPLSMILAAALPRATGKSSYTSPFHCELHCRGRAMIRYGMITDVSITRGVGNKGWTASGEPLGIDVSITVKDFSTMMYAPITPAFTAGKGILLKGAVEASDAIGGAGGAALVGATTALMGETWDDDNTFTNYLGVLGSLSLQDQVYPMNRWRLNVSRIVSQNRTFGTLPHVMNVAMGTFPGRVINALSLGTDRR